MALLDSPASLVTVTRTVNEPTDPNVCPASEPEPGPTTADPSPKSNAYDNTRPCGSEDPDALADTTNGATPADGDTDNAATGGTGAGGGGGGGGADTAGNSYAPRSSKSRGPSAKLLSAAAYRTRAVPTMSTGCSPGAPESPRSIAGDVDVSRKSRPEADVNPGSAWVPWLSCPVAERRAVSEV